MSRGLPRWVTASRGLLAGCLAVAMLALLPLFPGLASAQVRSPSGDASAFALQRMAEAPSARGRWDPCTVIGYRVNRALAGPGAVRDVREAVRRLSNATGLTFVYRGRTTLVPQADWGRDAYPADTQVIVAWVRPSRTTLWPEGTFSVDGRDVVAGTGGAWHVHATDSTGRLWGRYTRGFVLLNAGVTLPAGFAAVGPSGARGREIMHELGHLVGLDHPRLADPDQIMFPELTRRPGRWGSGDLTGLHRVGASGGCLHDL
jgi:hypothetical protein